MSDLVGNMEDIAPWRKAFDRMVIGSVERLARVVSVHWLVMVNLANFVFVMLAVLAPVLMAGGLTFPAKAIYLFYKGFCHQLPYRSYFISGYQMAFCQRNFAIFASMLVAGLIFAGVRGWLKPLDWRLYLALIAPMAVDGFTQLFGLRESNWELRTLTGSLFGFGTVWLTYPFLEMGMKDAREALVSGGRQVSIDLPVVPVDELRERRGLG